MSDGRDPPTHEWGEASRPDTSRHVPLTHPAPLPFPGTRARSASAKPKRAKPPADSYRRADRPARQLPAGVHRLRPEEPEGNVEYKLKLRVDHAGARFQHLVTQMKFRLTAGQGEAFYVVGVEDDGWPQGLDARELQASVATLAAMAESLGCQAQRVQEARGVAGTLAAVRIRRRPRKSALRDVQLAVAGAAEAGKSTLVAVLTRGVDGAPRLDDGRGSARTAVLRHKHEIASGRTSSVSRETLGYTAAGRPLNYMAMSHLTPAEISTSEETAKLLTLLDVGGCAKYLKAAAHAFTSLLPDACMLCVSAARGVEAVTREHLAVAVALGVPVFVVVTQADLAGPAGPGAAVEEVAALLGAARASGGRGSASRSRPAPSTATSPAADASAFAAAASPALPPAAESSNRLEALAAGSFDDLWEEERPEEPKEAPPASAGVRVLRGRAEAEAAGRAFGEAFRAGAAAGAVPCPVIPVSSVSGGGVATLHAFLSGLDHREPPEPSAGPAGSFFQVHRTFDVPEVGSVAYGAVVGDGEIAVGELLSFGPVDGEFKPVAVTGIQQNQVPVRRIQAGMNATVAVQLLEPGEAAGAGRAAAGGPIHRLLAATSDGIPIPARKAPAAKDPGGLGSPLGSSPSARKGTVLLRAQHDPQTVWRFDADVLRVGQWPGDGVQVQLVSGAVRQVAKLVAAEAAAGRRPAHPGEARTRAAAVVLRGGRAAAPGWCRCSFAFLHRPEWLQESQLVLVQDAERMETIGLGHVAAPRPT